MSLVEFLLLMFINNVLILELIFSLFTNQFYPAEFPNYRLFND